MLCDWNWAFCIFLRCVILVFSVLFHFTVLWVFDVLLLQDITPILIIRKWLKHFERATKNHTSDGNTQQSYFVADSAHTNIRNRTELQFCRQMNKTWINENKKPNTLFMLLFCLVLHSTFSLEHCKIKISDPRNLLRIRLRLEAFEDWMVIHLKLDN